MNNYKCLCELIDDNSFDIEHIINYYISYISIFYCTNIDLDDEIKSKISDLENYIHLKIKRKDDINV